MALTCLLWKENTTKIAHKIPNKILIKTFSHTHARVAHAHARTHAHKYIQSYKTQFIVINQVESKLTLKHAITLNSHFLRLIF